MYIATGWENFADPSEDGVMLTWDAAEGKDGWEFEDYVWVTGVNGGRGDFVSRTIVVPYGSSKKVYDLTAIVAAGMQKYAAVASQIKINCQVEMGWPFATVSNLIQEPLQILVMADAWAEEVDENDNPRKPDFALRITGSGIYQPDENGKWPATLDIFFDTDRAYTEVEGCKVYSAVRAPSLLPSLNARHVTAVTPRAVVPPPCKFGRYSVTKVKYTKAKAAQACRDLGLRLAPRSDCIDTAQGPVCDDSSILKALDKCRIRRGISKEVMYDKVTFRKALRWSPKGLKGVKRNVSASAICY
jgi:hypothetical protein